MKCSLLVLAAGLATAQSSTNSYVTDINGHRVLDGSIVTAKAPGVVEKTERSQSINGREVPLEQIETHVLREDAGGKVTEKITRRFDQTGRLSSSERVLTEEQKRADGGGTTSETVARTDVNGRLNEVERRTSEKRVQGTTTSVDTAIERKSVNGSFDVAVKRSSVSEKTATGESFNESELRRSQDGQFHEAFRKVIEKTVAGNQTTESSAEYEIGATGKMDLARQSAAVTTKGPDGREVSEVNLYARAADGHVQNPGAAQQIKEQQIIERIPGANGEVTEIVSVRRPSVSDATRLGELRKISETVCRGNCKP